MEHDDDWRARRAAELIGTPFERPRPPARDRIDDTLPIQRPEPAVFAAAARSAKPSLAGAGALPPPSAYSAWPGGAAKWWLGAAGLLAIVIAALVWVSGGRKTTGAVPPVSIDRPAPVVRPTIAVVPRQEARVEAPVAPVEAPVARVDQVDPTIVAIPPPRPRAEPQSAAQGAKIVAAHRDKGAVPQTRVKAKATEPTAHNAKTVTAQRPTVLPIITVSAPRCNASSSRVEVAICASPMLTASDRQARELYAGVIVDGDQHLIAKAQKGEVGFLKKRDRCKDDACLARVYKQRVDALQKLRKKAAVAQARAIERALPVCGQGQTPSPTVCRPAHRRFSLKRLFGG